LKARPEPTAGQSTSGRKRNMKIDSGGRYDPLTIATAACTTPRALAILAIRTAHTPHTKHSHSRQPHTTCHLLYSSMSPVPTCNHRTAISCLRHATTLCAGKQKPCHTSALLTLVNLLNIHTPHMLLLVYTDCSVLFLAHSGAMPYANYSCRPLRLQLFYR
jgi:hypothetical protein